MFFLIKKNSFNVRRVINITQEFFLTKKKQNIFSPFSPYYNIKKQIRKLHDRQIKEQTWKNPATTACSPNLQKVIEKKIYVRQFIWLTRVILSIIFNKGHMYYFFWTEGQKKKKIITSLIHTTFTVN